MKKSFRRTAAFVLALTLVAGTLPANVIGGGLFDSTAIVAKADYVDDTLVVGGTSVTSTTTSGTGWSFDTTTNTLTLNGAEISPSSSGGGSISISDLDRGIEYDGSDTLKILLVGTNTIDLSNSQDSTTIGIYSYASVVISGEGSLTVKGENVGIAINGDLTISGGTVTAVGTQYGVYANGVSTVGADANVTAIGDNIAFYGEVINANAGTGWTDAAGTEGEAAIEVNTAGQNLSDYKKVQFTAPAAPTPVPYMDWNETSKTLVEKSGDNACKEYTPVTSSTSAVTWENGWYVVSGDVTISKRIAVTGTVNLILKDGAKLTASQGITVNEGNTLNIYGQAGGTGALTAKGASYYRPGIGGAGYNAGTINIYGGVVTATGAEGSPGIGACGDYYDDDWGYGAYTRYAVNIYGGTVNATGGENGAGIGSGDAYGLSEGNDGSVYIYGGTVNAVGGSNGAGIGGGKANNGANVRIFGGNVTASGKSSAMGIGRGGEYDWLSNGSFTLADNLVLQNSTDNSTWENIAASNNDYTRTQYMRTAKKFAVGQFIAMREQVYIPADTYFEYYDILAETIKTKKTDSEYYCYLDSLDRRRQYTIVLKLNTGGGGLSIDFPPSEARTPAPTGFYVVSGDGTEAKPFKFSLDPPVQTIEVTSAPTALNPTYSGSAQNLVSAGTASDGATMYYALGDNATTAPTSGWDTTIPSQTDAGTYYVWYRAVNGDAESEPACVEASIEKATMDVTPPVENSTLEYDGTALNLLTSAPSITTGPSNPVISYAVTGEDYNGAVEGLTFSTDYPPTATAVGIYTVYYKVQGNNNYNDYLGDVSVQISKGQMTVTFPTAANLPYTGNRVDLLSEPPVILKGNTTDSILYAVTTGDNSPENFTTDLPTATAVGNYTVWYKVEGNDNYSDYSNSIEASITKATPAITLATSLTYDGNAKKLIDSITYAGGTDLYLCVKNANDTSYSFEWERYNNANDLTNDKLKATAAGTYNVYYYNDRTPPTSFEQGYLVGNVTISNGTLTGISAEDVVVTYDGAEHGITVNAPNGATVKYCSTENGTYTTNPITFTNATDGEQTVYYKVEMANYNTVSGSATVNISKAALTVTAKPKTITYGDAPANDGVEYSGFVNNETSAVLRGTLGYTYTYSQYGDVGNTYKITPSGLTSDNYNITFTAGTLTVEQKEIGIEWSDTELIYNGTPQKPTATAAGLVNGDSCTITVSGAQINASDEGYTATAASLSNANYKLPTANTTQFMISRADQSQPAITLESGLAYDGTEHSLISSGDAPHGTLTYALTAANQAPADGAVWTDAEDIKAANAGTYYVWYKSTGDGNHNDISAALAGSVTIARKTVTITPAAGQTKVYGTDDPASYGYTPAGLVGEDTLTGSLTRTSGEDAGNYDFVVTGLTNGNYNVVLAANASQFTITPKPITITAANKTITYGEAPTNNGLVDYSAQMVGNDTLNGTASYEYSYTQYEDAGNSYTITPSGLSNDNYTITFASGTLTVEQKEIGIEWSDTELIYNGTPQKPTATATGLVNGDSCTITVSGAQTNASDEGYTATAASLSNANYKLPTANTTQFKINRADLAADTDYTVPTANELNYTGEPKALVSSDAPAHGTMKYAVTADTVNTAPTQWSDDAPSETDAGTYRVWYYVVGGTNYNDTAASYVDVTIGKAASLVAAPTAEEPIHYNIAVQLVNAGTVKDGCTMYYLVSDEKPGEDAQGWSTKIPTANASGTYKVWYKVTGNENYADTAVCDTPVTVNVSQGTISLSQSFTVEMDSYVYDGTAHKPTIKGKTYGTVSYTYHNVDTGKELSEAPTAVGNYRVEVFASGDEAYESKMEYANYSITDAFAGDGIANVDSFKENDIVPEAEGTIFAGWFTDSTCTTPYTGDTGKAYAKFIDEKVLTVKAQISSGTTANSAKTSIRFITSLDSLKYENVGFKITFNGKTIDKSMTKVYTSINANGAKVKPTVFSADSRYMEAYTLNNIPNSAFSGEITVTPYYTTQDGTVVEGETKTFIIDNMIK